MKERKKTWFEILVGIATIISCGATVAALFMVRTIRNYTKIQVSEQMYVNQFINNIYNESTTRTDTVIVRNNDTVLIQTPAPIKIISDDTQDTLYLKLPPRIVSAKDLYVDSIRNEFTKFKLQQSREFSKFKEQYGL